MPPFLCLSPAVHKKGENILFGLDTVSADGRQFPPNHGEFLSYRLFASRFPPEGYCLLLGNVQWVVSGVTRKRREKKLTLQFSSDKAVDASSDRWRLSKVNNKI